MFKKIFSKNMESDYFIYGPNRKEQKRRFDLMLSLGQDIIKNEESNEKLEIEDDQGNQHPIYSYINLLGRKTQAEAMLETFSRRTEDPHYNHRYTETWFYEFTRPKIQINDNGEIKKCYALSLVKSTGQAISIELRNTLVIPWPWEYSRLVRAMRKYNDWKEDETNHFVYMWYPLGICFVGGGNHSIASGIIKGHGVIENVVIRDIRELYDHIYTDGLKYYSSWNNKSICDVWNVEYAAIFELGRIISEKGIEYNGKRKLIKKYD